MMKFQGVVAGATLPRSEKPPVPEREKKQQYERQSNP
jgi:hypothetical protein